MSRSMALQSEGSSSLPTSPSRQAFSPVSTPTHSGFSRMSSSLRLQLANKTTFFTPAGVTVKEPVGNMSISPSSRDICLAGRKGLHIIDLENPYQAPRHMQHMSAWEVADVQWNPHPSRDSWIVSTSNQKALVWNLNRDDIEFILHGHSRAITDINWSIFAPETVATSSIDTYIHCWDLRDPRKPVVSFYSWNSGATQVKFNRRNEHIVASSHDTTLRIWDDRKGSLPLHIIDAHDTKIYGIDWSHADENKIVTCSLDRMVKFWDLSLIADDGTKYTNIIRTNSPVWRARYTPFGQGIMTMPQRNENHLSLWAVSDTSEPVNNFVGHTDTVKEFLWRIKGGEDSSKDDRAFQLITWSKDQKLRLWPMENKLLLAVGHNPGQPFETPMPRRGSAATSFINPPKTHSSIGDSIAPRVLANTRSAALALIKGGPVISQGQETNSSPSTGGRRTRTNISDIAWMKGVKMYHSGSQGDEEDGDVAKDLGQEIVLAIKQFQLHIRFEKMNVAGDNRYCIFNFNGNWGEDNASVFMRFYVSFPKGYPEEEPPRFELQKTDRVPLGQRAQISEGLNRITEEYLMNQIPCFLPCLRFLLKEDGIGSNKMGEDDESDDESIIYPTRDNSSKNLTGLAAIRANDTNVPLPRRCGAVFCGNNMLVCFFPSTVLLEVQNTSKPIVNLGVNRVNTVDGNLKVKRLGFTFGQMQGSGESSSSTSEEKKENMPRRKRAYSIRGMKFFKSLFGNPLWSSSGVKRLRRAWRSSSSSIVRLRDISGWIPSNMDLAKEYVLNPEDPMHACIHNAQVAEKYGRADVVRAWYTLATILADVVPLSVVMPAASDSKSQEQRQGPKKQNATKVIATNLSESPMGSSFMPAEGGIVIASRASALQRRRDSALSFGSSNISSPKTNRVVKLQIPEITPSSLRKIDEVKDPVHHVKATLHDGLSGRVKWGIHPSGKKLIMDLFQYFEQLQDVQMLAMMTCVLSEDAVVVQQRLSQVLHTPATPGSSALSASADYFSNQYLINGYPHQPPFFPRASSFTLLPGYSNRTPIPIPQNSLSSLSSSKGSWSLQNNQDGLGNSVPSATPPTPGMSTLFRSELAPGFTDSYHTTTVAQGNVTNRNPTGLARTQSSTSIFGYHQQQIAAHRRSVGMPNAYNGTSVSPPTPRRISPYFGAVDLPLQAAPICRERKDSVHGSLSGGASGGGASSGSWGLTNLIGPSGPVTEDVPEANKPSLAKGSTRIQVVMMNQDSFDDEKTPRYMPLLDQGQEPKFICYILFYADLLYRWGLQTGRAEVLKYLQRHSVHPLDLRRQSVLEDRGLEIAMACAECMSLLDRDRPHVCLKCHRRSSTAGTFQCMVCHVSVRGLSIFCFMCNHGGHAAHYRKWFTYEKECPSGCGCECLLVDGGTGSFEVVQELVEEKHEEENSEHRRIIKPWKNKRNSTFLGSAYESEISDDIDDEEMEMQAKEEDARYAFAQYLNDEDPRGWKVFQREIQQW